MTLKKIIIAGVEVSFNQDSISCTCNGIYYETGLNNLEGIYTHISNNTLIK